MSIIPVIHFGRIFSVFALKRKLNYVYINDHTYFIATTFGCCHSVWSSFQCISHQFAVDALGMASGSDPWVLDPGEETLKLQSVMLFSQIRVKKYQPHLVKIYA